MQVGLNANDAQPSSLSSFAPDGENKVLYL